MKVITNGDEFMAQMEAMFGPPREFTPTVTYIPGGDCLEFVARPGQYHAQRLDDRVTVYLSMDDDQIIGSLIKGVTDLWRQLSQTYPGLQIIIEKDRIRLEHLFLARVLSQPKLKRPVADSYRKLIEMAEETRAETELCFA